MLELTENAIEVLNKRYLQRDDAGNVIETPEQMFRRVADHVAGAEETPELQKEWSDKFYKIMTNLEFLPNSPTLRNAGANKGCLSACFSFGTIGDSRRDIFQTLMDAVEVQAFGGGCGYDFSGLRPAGALINSTKGRSCGPIGFMKVYNLTVGEIIAQGGVRHGAQLGLLRVDHPDILKFINCKTIEGQLSNFNISVAITDEFMEKICTGGNFRWELKFNNKVWNIVDGLEIWNAIVENIWKNGEPGIIFIDRVNKLNPLKTFQTITSPNPCQEATLAAYESCNLGSINLRRFITNNTFDFDKLNMVVCWSVRFLDNVITINNYPLKIIEDQTLRTRKIGLVVMGWADALIKLGIVYGSEESLELADHIMSNIHRTAWDYSKELAKEKGSLIIDGEDLARRNGILTIIAPTGSLSLIAGCSAGIEPIFSFEFKKKCIGGEITIVNPLLLQWLENHDSTIEEEPDYFIEAKDVIPEQHIRMQAVYQRHTDGAISKCISLDSFITTSRGIIRLGDLCTDRTVGKFTKVDDVAVFTQGGVRKVNEFYYNGDVLGKRIVTRNGLELEGTYEHRILVLNNRHEKVWKSLKELSIGDIAIFPLGNSNKSVRYIPKILGKEFTTPLENTKKIHLPFRTSVDFLWWLGCVQADGYVDKNGVHFTQVEGPVLHKWIELSRELFGIEPRIHKQSGTDNVMEVDLTSRVLRDWMNYIGFSKHDISPVVLCSGRLGKMAYIEGCTLDGTCTKNVQLKCDKDHNFIKQLQLLCLNVGIPTYILVGYNKRYAKHFYKLNIQRDVLYSTSNYFKFPEEHKQYNFISLSNKNRIRNNVKNSFVMGNTPIPVDDSFLAIMEKLMGQYKYSYELWKEVYDQKLIATKNKSLPLQQIIKIYCMANELPGIFKQKYLFSAITKIEDAYIETGDISVEYCHDYISNGFISHNTINASNNTTVEDVDKAFRLSWELGCKGITFYRQGSREYEAQTPITPAKELHEIGRGLSHRQFERAIEEEKPVSIENTETPEHLFGERYRIKTGDGTLWVHLFENKDTGFREIWTNISKPGRTMAVMADITGRLCSLALKYGASWEDLEKQLKGHIGDNPIWWNGERILSIPDALSKLIRKKYLSKRASSTTGGLPAQSFKLKVSEETLTIVVCPDCATPLIHDEGCKGGRCPSCGFSSC